MIHSENDLKCMHKGTSHPNPQAPPQSPSTFFFFEDVEKKVGLKSPKLHTPR